MLIAILSLVAVNTLILAVYVLPSLPYEVRRKARSWVSRYRFSIAVNSIYPRSNFKELRPLYKTYEEALDEMIIWQNEHYPKQWYMSDPHQVIHVESVGSSFKLGQIYRHQIPFWKRNQFVKVRRR